VEFTNYFGTKFHAKVESITVMSGVYEIIRDIPYCCEECRYLEWDNTDGWCLLLKKELNFYDWFIAECASKEPVEYRLTFFGNKL
jgi:hypothetical protein